MIDKLVSKFRYFYESDTGLSAVEYVVAGSLVVAVLAAGFTLLGGTAGDYLTSLNDSMDWE